MTGWGRGGRWTGVAAASAALLFGACGRGGEEQAGEGRPKYRFAVIPKALDIPVFNYARIGAQRAARELGNVEVIWRAPETADPLKQKEVLESFITQRVDGIAISCVNGDLLTETINKAIASGIPVVTWDSDAPKSNRIAFWGVDDFASGQLMGHEAAKLVGGKGKVALITSLGADNLRRRLEGVQDALKHYPGLRVIETFDIKEDTIRCTEVIATTMNRHPDLALWISVGGWPVFARNALDPVDPAKTKAVVFDTIPPAPEVMKAGKVQLLVGQKYFGWGSEPVNLLHGIKQGRMPSQTIINSGVDIVTKANVEQYAVEFKKLEAGQ